MSEDWANLDKQIVELCGLREAEDPLVTREKRLADFSSAPPTESKSLKLLCEDHSGTYVLPYPCRWTGDAWINAKSGHHIVAKVLGWRFWQPS
jgi:hypothetical protein